MNEDVTQDPIVLRLFKIPVDITLNSAQEKEAMAGINYFYCGDVECNMYDEREHQYKSKYPKIEKETPQWQKACYNALRTYRVSIGVELLEDGTLRISNSLKALSNLSCMDDLAAEAQKLGLY